MLTCRIILHGDLPDLVRGRRETERRLPVSTSLEDAIEALGIPHTEFDRLTRDGVPAAPGDLVRDGAAIEVWPTRPYDLDDPRFVCDLHLGKLARLLRFCGFDTVWDRTLREPGLALLAARQRRTVISRHRALLTRNAVARGLLVRADDADTQLAGVLRRFRLADRITSPGRCTRCNGELEPRHRDQVPVPIPPRTAAWRDRYWLCRECGHLFWEGTHVARLRARVVRAAAEAR
jgi:hypothetical protein